MECTQRLDFDDSQYTQSERACPEQLAFLGILGSKYPVKKGPNKIGRDPKTCSIVLDRNSISRQHAVINVLSGPKYMLMDLDSVNKTKLNNKTLHSYIPATLSNGDTVQFGEVFGIFQLLEDEADLPCTQAVDVPDTPVLSRHASRLKQAIVPESPEVSDRDDSFILPSQPKSEHQFKSPLNKFIKPSSKTIAIQPVGTNKIDNVYWNSSKKSTSFNLDDSDNNVNGDIHEMETQAPFPNDDERSDSIYTAETQVPPGFSPPIHSMDTQLPPEHLSEASKIGNHNEIKINNIAANKENAGTEFVNAEKDIVNKPNICGEGVFTADTQLPFETQSTSHASKTIFDPDTQFVNNDTELSTEPKNECIFTANTQFSSYNEQVNNPVELKSSVSNDKSNNNNTSKDEIIMFDEIDSQPIIDDLSQPLIDSDPLFNQENLEEDIPLSQADTIGDDDEVTFDESDKQPTPMKRDTRIKSDSSTDCEDLDFLPTQKIPAKPLKDDDLTDCEDESEMVASARKTAENPTVNVDKFSSSTIKVTAMGELTKLDNKNPNNSAINFEDLATQVIDEDVNFASNTIKVKSIDKLTKLNSKNEKNPAINFEDLATQVIAEDNDSIAPNTLNSTSITKPPISSNFEDLPTQIIPEDNINNLATQVIAEDNDNIAPNTLNSTSITKPPISSNFEDLPTQIILGDNINNDPNFEDLPTQVIEEVEPKKPDAEEPFSEEMISPFKIPFSTPFKPKKKDTFSTSDSKAKVSPQVLKPSINDAYDDKYYAATQDILEDLCSQPIVDVKTNIKNNHLLNKRVSEQMKGDEFVVCVDNYKACDKSLHIKNNLSPKNLSDSDLSDGNEAVNKFLSGLSAQQIGEVIGVDVAKLKKIPSDPSDTEVTPKKVRPFKFIQTELPDSQEIKTTVSLSSKTPVTESSSESEQEQDSQEQTPILFHKKKGAKANVKKDLTTKFDIQALPSRILTRTRKPASKLRNSDTVNILKPLFLREQDDDVDTEIISENITRLKNKSEKKNQKDVTINKTKIEKSNVKHISTEVVTVENKQKTTRRRKIEKTKKNDDIEEVIDLDSPDPSSKSQRTSRSKNNNNNISTDNTKSKRVKLKKDTEIKMVRTERTKKKDSQDKITNYTISTLNQTKMSNKSCKDDSLNSSKDTNGSLRSTRSKNKDHSKNNENKSVSPTMETITRKRGRSKKTETEDKKTKKGKKDVTKDKTEKKEKKEPETKPETRRSKRQKVSNDKSGSQHHEQSTIYNISSESNVESPRSLKRAASGIEVVPNPKRTRSAANSTVISSTVSSKSSSLRSTPSRGANSHRVLFTAFPCEEVKGKLEKLGASVVSDVLSCTVVLTLQLRRTFKLLCAVGLGRPVVGPAWLQACLDTNTVVDPWLYLIKDESSEKRFGFNLSRTLCGPRDYLRGALVSSTASVLPSAMEMKLIVECSGGTWLDLSSVSSPPPGWVVVSCAADRSQWAGLRQRGATLVSSEFILSGVLRQKYDLEGTLLP